jgi:hypothetical protein
LRGFRYASPITVCAAIEITTPAATTSVKASRRPRNGLAIAAVYQYAPDFIFGTASQALGQQGEDLQFVFCRLFGIIAVPASVAGVQQQLFDLVVAVVLERNRNVDRDGLRLQFATEPGQEI